MMLRVMRSDSRSHISAIVSIFILLFVKYANGRPLQYLQPIDGYIPVYIRLGDQPLEEINLELAEAFHETVNYPKVAHAGSSATKSVNKEFDGSNNFPLEKENINADDLKLKEPVVVKLKSSTLGNLNADDIKKAIDSIIPCASCKIPIAQIRKRLLET